MGYLLRKFEENDINLFSAWLDLPHIKPWFKHKKDWLNEINNRYGNFSFIHHFIFCDGDKPIGFCQYYDYSKGGETFFNSKCLDNVFSIDYLICDENYLHNGLSKTMVSLLENEIRKNEKIKVIVVQPAKGNVVSRSLLLSSKYFYDELSDCYLKYFDIPSFSKPKVIMFDIGDFDWEKYDDACSVLPNYRIDKINKFKNVEDRKLSFLAGYLIHNELGDFDKYIVKNKYGKPYFSGNPFYFSVSHSESKVIISFFDRPIGCDIESFNREIDLNISEKFFDRNEHSFIVSSKNPKKEFIRMWTIKESYLKCIGTGLNKPLNSIIVNEKTLSDKDYCVFETKEIGDKYIFSIVIKREE